MDIRLSSCQCVQYFVQIVQKFNFVATRTFRQKGEQNFQTELSASPLLLH